MKKTFFALTALIAVIAAAPANAGQVAFNFATNMPLIGGSVTGSGFFTTAALSTIVGGQTAFDITSITGTVNGSAIVAPTGDYGNYFTTGPAFLDGTGLRFFTASGIDVRLFYQDTVGKYRVNTFGTMASSSFVAASATPVAAAVPEPATWSLLLAGLAAVGAGLGFRRGRAKAQFA